MGFCAFDVVHIKSSIKQNFVFADHDHKHTYNGQKLQAITMGVGKVITIREVGCRRVVGGSNILWVVFINIYHDCVDYNYIIFLSKYSFHKLDFDNINNFRQGYLCMWTFSLRRFSQVYLVFVIHVIWFSAFEWTFKKEEGIVSYSKLHINSFATSLLI